MSNWKATPNAFSDGPHVPGSWKVENGRSWIASQVSDEKAARLIAAAPDLLAALEGIMGWWVNALPVNGEEDEMPPPLFDASRAAIAKAEGKG